jgi:2-polyprenyl-3-methyl-5-hydroxy-6-metoxy-1,4-benzoquinol methylase
MTALERFEPPRRRSCPVCGSFRRRDPVRFPGRTYFRCGDCGIIYLLSFTGKTTEYGEEYFFDEYERQYGRTYLEDLPHIIELSRPRVDILASLLGRGRVLDIGCAYGGFLRAARDRGFEVFGTDISESAVEYVSRTLGMTASASSFDRFVPAESFGISRFDALTMWFVLEHFEDTDAILERCSGMIEEGGILALALPNGAGISARKDRRRFLENSPGDHRTVWTPRSAARVLRRYGFTPVRVRITGHHPERFPGASGIGTESPVFRVLRRVSLLLRLGDTFEIYARKTGGRGRSSGGRG